MEGWEVSRGRECEEASGEGREKAGEEEALDASKYVRRLSFFRNLPLLLPPGGGRCELLLPSSERRRRLRRWLRWRRRSWMNHDPAALTSGAGDMGAPGEMKGVACRAELIRHRAEGFFRVKKTTVPLGRAERGILSSLASSAGAPPSPSPWLALGLSSLSATTWLAWGWSSLSATMAGVALGLLLFLLALWNQHLSTVGLDRTGTPATHPPPLPCLLPDLFL